MFMRCVEDFGADRVVGRREWEYGGRDDEI